MHEVLQWLLGLLAATVSAVVTGVLIPALVRWLNSKTHHEKQKAVITEIGNLVSQSVSFIEQTVVSQLKADGGWNAEGQKEALNRAVQNVFDHISDKTRNIISANTVDIESFIIQSIEAEIERRHNINNIRLKT